MTVRVGVQQQDFNVGELYNQLAGDPSSGAVSVFCGLVRDDDGELEALELEHYPVMTEKALNGIVEQARKRWSLNQVTVIHRVGYLRTNEQIVFVGVTSGHRHDAFEATHFIMDYLKTRAPFWKKEHFAKTARWVEAKVSDEAAAKRWQGSDACGD